MAKRLNKKTLLIFLLVGLNACASYPIKGYEKIQKSKFKLGKNDCSNKSDEVIKLITQQGGEARQIFGYQGKGYFGREYFDGIHAWVEQKKRDRWYTLDPTTATIDGKPEGWPKEFYPTYENSREIVLKIGQSVDEAYKLTPKMIEKIIWKNLSPKGFKILQRIGYPISPNDLIKHKKYPLKTILGRENPPSVTKKQFMDNVSWNTQNMRLRRH